MRLRDFVRHNFLRGRGLWSLLLFAMWMSHALLFRGGGLAGWVGLAVVAQNVIGSLFNNLRWLVFYVLVPTGVGLGLAMLANSVTRGQSLLKLIYFLPYTLPPQPDRPNFITMTREAFEQALAATGQPPADAVRKALGGVGPVLLREVVHRAFGPAGQPSEILSQSDAVAALWQQVEGIRADWAAGGKPNLVRKPDGDPAEFSFTPLTQYLPECRLEDYPDFSVLLEAYYAQKDRAERLRQRSKALRKTVQNMYDRAVRKQAARVEELAESEKSDHLRIAGELLTANLHSIEKGAKEVRLQNWYDGEEVLLKLDPRLGPSANAQRYFKDYKKRQTATKMLAKLLADGERFEAFLGEPSPGAGPSYLAGSGSQRPRWDAHFFWRHGRRYDANCSKAPFTAAQLERLPLGKVPGHGPECLFSILGPGSEIQRHTGVTNTRVVTHSSKYASRVPVRAATTLAAARGRAPDWTRWRRASTAKPTSWSWSSDSPRSSSANSRIRHRHSEKSLTWCWCGSAEDWKIPTGITMYRPPACPTLAGSRQCSGNPAVPVAASWRRTRVATAMFIGRRAGSQGSPTASRSGVPAPVPSRAAANSCAHASPRLIPSK